MTEKKNTRSVAERIGLSDGATEDDESTERAGSRQRAHIVYSFAKSRLRFPATGESLSPPSVNEFLSTIDAWRAWVELALVDSETSLETKHYVSEQVLAVGRVLQGIRAGELSKKNERVDRLNLFLRDALEFSLAFTDPEMATEAIIENAAAYGFGMDVFTVQIVSDVVRNLKAKGDKKRSRAIFDLTKAAALAAGEAWNESIRPQDVRRAFDEWETSRRARLKLSPYKSDGEESLPT